MIESGVNPQALAVRNRLLFVLAHIYALSGGNPRVEERERRRPASVVVVVLHVLYARKQRHALGPLGSSWPRPHRLTIPIPQDTWKLLPQPSLANAHTVYTMAVSLLLSLSLLLLRVLADLTDDQAAIVKQRLAERSQQRCPLCTRSDTFSSSSHVIAGSSAQEHRRFSNSTALDTRSPHPGPNFRQATPTRRPRSRMSSPLRAMSFPSRIPPKTPRSRSWMMVPPATHQVSELPSSLQTGRINRQLTVRTMHKPSRTSSTISIPFRGQATVQSPIALVSSSSGEIINRSTRPRSSYPL